MSDRAGRVVIGLLGHATGGPRFACHYIAAQTDIVTQRLAWLTTDIDHLAAAGQPLTPEHRRRFQELTTKLTALSHDTARLAKDTTDLLPTPDRATPTVGHEPRATERPQRTLER